MTTPEVLQVLEKLADGFDPATGQRLPADTPCRQPYVRRALFTAIERLQAAERQAQRQAVPAKAGSAWTAGEDRELRLELAAGTRLADMATAHARTPGAILTRLVHLGLFHNMDEARAALERKGERGGVSPPLASS